MNSVKARRQLGKMTSWHGWKQVVFTVKKHVVSNGIEPTIALGAARFESETAIVMHRPYGKESGKALAQQHGSHVPVQRG